VLMALKVIGRGMDVGVAVAACWALASFELDSMTDSRSATATRGVRE